MEQWGFDGVEFFGDVVGNEKKYQDALRNTKLKMAAVCWGSCNGESGLRRGREAGRLHPEVQGVLTAAGALGSTGVVYVPAFNGQTKLTNQEIRKILLDTLPEIGEHAVKAGTRVVMEPLNRKEAFFLRLVADAAASPAIAKAPASA